jgi:hypothetical protein
MEKTLKVQVKARVSEFIRRHLLDFVYMSQDKESDLIAVWQKDRTDTWYDHPDGHEFKYKDIY